MKTIGLLVILIGITLLSSCEKKKQTTLKGIPVTFSVDGMTCQGCVDNIEKTLSSIDGVLKYDVKLKENLAIVEYDPEKTSLEAIEMKLKDTNFKIGKK